MTRLLTRLFIKDYLAVSEPRVRSNYGMMSSIVGIILNFLLFVLKIIIGLVAHSVSIVADAFNNLSDGGSSLISLVGFKIAEKPADREHPHGHGRIEYVTGLIIGIIVILMGYEVLRSSIGRLLDGNDDLAITLPVMMVLAATILVKLWMFIFYRQIGTTIDSLPIKAVAMDSIGDVLATSVVLIGSLVNYLTGVNIDGYIGIVVALFIMYSGLMSCKEAADSLIGEAPDDEKLEAFYAIVNSHPEIIGIDELVVHDYGPGRKTIVMKVRMSDQMEMEEAHNYITHIEDEIYEKMGSKAIIHIDPVEKV